MKRLLTIALFVSGLLSTVAQAGIVLSPPVQEITISRGKTTAFTYSASNNGDQAETVQFIMRNMDITVEGQPYASDSTYDRGCAEWITLDPTEVTLAPLERITINGVIEAPRDADGSYYAMLVVNVNQQEVEMDDGGAGFVVQSQAGVVLMAMTNSSRNAAVLYPDTLMVYPHGEQSARTQQTFGNTDSWEIVLPVRNEGNAHTSASGDLSLWSSAGVRLETVPLASGQGYILPGKSRYFRAQGGGALADGYYVMSFNLRTSEGRTISENMPFSIRESEVFFNETIDETEELLRAAMPRFRLRTPVLTRKLSPGGDSYVAINMQNVSEDTIVIHPEQMEWYIDKNGRSRFDADYVPHNRSSKPWIEILDEEVVLLPKRSVSVKTRVHAPEDAVEGEYYSAITFQPEGVDESLLEKFRGARTQLLIFQGTNEGTASVEIDSIYVNRRSGDDGRMYADFEFYIRNTGTKYCYADGNIVLEKEVARGVYDLFSDAPVFGGRQAVIMPNSERLFQLSIPDLPSGKYRAVFRVGYEMDSPNYIKPRIFTL